MRSARVHAPSSEIEGTDLTVGTSREPKRSALSRRRSISARLANVAFTSRRKVARASSCEPANEFAITVLQERLLIRIAFVVRPNMPLKRVTS
jgi:hypothetical protein